MYLKTLLSIACVSIFMLTCPLEAHSSSIHQHHSSSKSGPYARGCSLVNQQPTSLDPQVATIGQLNESNGVRLKNNRLIVDEAGKYFITVSVQAGVITSLAPVAYVNLWIIKGGIPLDETRTSASIINNQAIVPLSSQAVLELKKHDAISVGFSSTNKQVGLIASTNPIVPSLTVSLFRIN